MSVPEIFMRARDFLLTCFSLNVLTGLVPAFLLAGALAVFVSQALVLKYLGAKTNKFVSYSIATVAGIVLSVCSCTAIPLFAGIRKRGAGLGPAIAFLCAAPALDILPIIYTFRLIGNQFGWARLIGGVGLSVILGLLLALIFREEKSGINADLTAGLPQNEENKPWWMQVIFFGLLIAMMILTTANSWLISAALLVILAVFFWRFYTKDDFGIWMRATLQFVRTILPWLLIGSIGATLIYVFVPTGFVSQYAGGNSFLSSLITALFGAVNYLCPPSEVLFTKAFVDLGMGKGPALAFILTGPAVSLPSMIVLVKLIGLKKSLTYIVLLIVLATLMGYIYGLF
jgi:uncharacterized membrane protein YraQ (UPF0718 family)